MSRFLLPVLLFLAVAATTQAHEHQCIHDDPDHQAGILSSLLEDQEEAAHMPAERSFVAAADAVPKPIRIRIFTKDLYNEKHYCLDGKRASVPKLGRPTMLECPADGSHDLTTKRRNYLVNRLLPAAQVQLSALLSTVPLAGNRIINKCGGMTVPASHGKGGVEDADFVLYVSAYPTFGTTAAHAGACKMDFKNGLRPFAGSANFGPKYLDDSSSLESRVLITVHEIMHALGFSSTYFGKGWFPGMQTIPTVTIKGRRGIPESTLIAGPATIREVRAWHGCYDLEGAELENQGGGGTAGSHFERRLLKHDIMAGVVGFGMSRVTLAVFEDLGWYTPNYTALDHNPAFSGKATTPRFGKDLGCGFVKERCNTTEGGRGSIFCFESLRNECLEDYSSTGSCFIKTQQDALPEHMQYFGSAMQGGSMLMDGCPELHRTYNKVCANSDLAGPMDFSSGATFSVESRCFKVASLRRKPMSFMSPFNTSNCMRSRCTGGVVQVTPDAGASATWATCGAEGTLLQLDGFNGHVVCPDPVSFCKYHGGAPPPVETTSPTETASTTPAPVTAAPTESPSPAPVTVAPTKSPTPAPVTVAPTESTTSWHANSPAPVNSNFVTDAPFLVDSRSARSTSVASVPERETVIPAAGSRSVPQAFGDHPLCGQFCWAIYVGCGLVGLVLTGAACFATWYVYRRTSVAPDHSIEGGVTRSPLCQTEQPTADQPAAIATLEGYVPTVDGGGEGCSAWESVVHRGEDVARSVAVVEHAAV